MTGMWWRGGGRRAAGGLGPYERLVGPGALCFYFPPFSLVCGGPWADLAFSHLRFVLVIEQLCIKIC